MLATETVFGQTLALWFGNGDERHTLEFDTTGLNVKGNLYLTPSALGFGWYILQLRKEKQYILKA